MSFDKIKAMRNAERYLSQGKIRSAIGEYRQVVDNDIKDIGTLNLLGDLYTKNSQKNEAVKCYTAVAEHYSNQGFAQKAIAIYNKIAKLEPNSVEVSSKLAELYKVKGSVTEARSHYITLAEHYQANGRRIEALAIWKQIALLDLNNIEVYPTIAESYVQEGEIDDAADAWAEAGLRFARLGRSEEADSAFSKALDLKPTDAKALSGFVEAKLSVGRQDEAIEKLNALLEAEPHNRDVLSLQISCYLQTGDIAAAEKAVIRLVELEPANYPRFLELAQIYIAEKDSAAATRILSMSSEHLLVGGQAEEFNTMVSAVLEENPECLDALRLRARYCTWQRDETAFRESLDRLAEVAARTDAVEDERYALSQLVMIVPHEVRYVERLKEINELYGYDQQDVEESLFDKQFLKTGAAEQAIDALPVPADYASIPESAEIPVDNSANVEFSIVENIDHDEPAFVTEVPELERSGVAVIEAVEHAAVEHTAAEAVQVDFGDSPEHRLRKEAESIKFYIDSGYTELAEKAIDELYGEFGDRSEVSDLKLYLNESSGNSLYESPAPVAEPEPVASADAQPIGVNTGSFDLNELRSELGLEEADPADDSDYETHYHTAVAYQEMGLIEDAIREFQEAVSLVDPNDGTRRFFQCANLLGHCFMQQQMPNLALTWYQRTLETPGLNDDEKQALWYELAAAYEAEGDMESAGRYFEQVYAENINFRDVSQRVKNMTVNH